MMISHSAGIRDIKNLSCGNLHSPTSACVARGCSEGVSFTTCSEDGTIRLWDLYLQMDPLQANGSSNASTQGTMHLGNYHICSELWKHSSEDLIVFGMFWILDCLSSSLGHFHT